MRRMLSLILGAFLFLGCSATSPVKPITSPGTASRLSDEEERLWHQAQEFDSALIKSDQLFTDTGLQTYLQQILENLFPTLAGDMRISVVTSPYLNAFALPNGSLYINIGMLARAENEAQLATVLGHEAAHFVDKHGLRQRRTLKSASAFALGVGFIGIPFMGELLAASSIYGYSRDLERTADQLAFERLLLAGYDTREGSKIFEHLRDEAKAMEKPEPFFFSSHPKMEERIESFRALNAVRTKPGGGYIGTERYQAITMTASLAALESDRVLNRYQSLILMLEPEQSGNRFPPAIRYFYLGEAYRLRGEPEDTKRATNAYRNTLKSDPGFAEAHRSLGILYLKSGNGPLAKEHLSSYLRLSPEAPDRGYIEQYIDQINQTRPQP